MAEAALPLLRQELRLVVGADGPMIFDPLRHRYFNLPDIATAALAEWHLGKPEKLLAAVKGLTPQDLGALVDFLQKSRLTAAPAGGIAGLVAEKNEARHSPFKALVHNYLFFRVPLVQPQRFLDWAAPHVAPLYGRPAKITYVLSGLMGLYLVSRQWDQFMATFLHFFSLQGALYYGLALILLKVFHELGHAFAAQARGCRVPVLGVAFMMMFPMLYTDVTDAWRLEQRSERMRITAAGVMVEFAIAALALLAWSFLPDGPLRSAAFFLATTAWIGSLIVNMSPFMRFDGYHLLADGLGVANLGPRSFALARWQLREHLFGLEHPPPEVFTPAMRRTLVAYAWATWIYRLILFTGIALLIYYAFPKVIGVPLFIVEIVYFIWKPIMQELATWFAMRKEIMVSPRARKTGAIVAGLLLLALLPLDRHVNVPAVLMAGEEWRAFAPEPSRIASVNLRVGQRVSKGDVLLILAAPDLEQEARAAQIKLDIVEARLRRVAGDATDRSLIAVLEREKRALVETLNGLAARGGLLTLRAPFDGAVAEIAEGLRPGLWLGRKTAVAEIIGSGPAVIRGLVGESDVARLYPGADGVFIGEEAEAPRITVKLGTVGSARATGMELPLLASLNGGPIAAEMGPDKQLVAKTGVFPVTADTTETTATRRRRGTLVVRANSQSLAAATFRRIAAVLLRESGF